MSKIETVFGIYCSTGCTCCSGDNFTMGFFKTKEETDAKVAQFRSGDGNPLASQYSKYGNYRIREYEAEHIPGERVIINGMVFDSDVLESTDNRFSDEEL